MKTNMAIYFDHSVRVRIDEKTADEFFYNKFLEKLKDDRKVYKCNDWFEIVKIDDNHSNTQLVIATPESKGATKKIPLNFDELAHILYLWVDFFSLKATQNESDNFTKELYIIDLDSLQEDDLYHQIMYEYIDKALREYYG